MDLPQEQQAADMMPCACCHSGLLRRFACACVQNDTRFGGSRGCFGGACASMTECRPVLLCSQPFVVSGSSCIAGQDRFYPASSCKNARRPCVIDALLSQTSTLWQCCRQCQDVANDDDDPMRQSNGHHLCVRYPRSLSLELLTGSLSCRPSTVGPPVTTSVVRAL
jgi:hypothetical protein